MLQTVRGEKVDKNGVICLVSMLPSWVMVLKLSKKVHFLQFCADLSQKPKFVETIYIYGSDLIWSEFLLQSFRKWYAL